MDAESKERLARIIRGQRVAALGTLREGAPLVSLVAYSAAADFSVFYIHASRLAQHTQDFLNDPRASLMIAEADDGRRDPQTLGRLSMRGVVREVPKDAQEYMSAGLQYLGQFPEARVTFQLGDFGLYRFEPEKARYVAGLGKAFNLQVKDLLLASGVEGKDE